MRVVTIADLSPNQREKQQQIIEAAKAVLLREGIAGCTARVLADESSFSRSAIHYYFGSMDEIVDAAMASHLADFVGDLRATAAAYDDPVTRFWAVTERYLVALGEQPEREVQGTVQLGTGRLHGRVGREGVWNVRLPLLGIGHGRRGPPLRAAEDVVRGVGRDAH